MHQEQMRIMAGDFNMTTSKEEKKGGIQREAPEMERFIDLQMELRLVDIPTINGKFTWNNRRGGNKQIASRLERFLASEQLIRNDIFYEASILPSIGSDHWPIKLEIAVNPQNKKRPFRFEAFRLTDPNFTDKMKTWWQESNTGMEGRNKMNTFQIRLKDLKGKVKKWNREEFGNIQKERKTTDKNGGNPTTNHRWRKKCRADRGGREGDYPNREKKKARRNSMETKITSPMVERRGEKFKILSQSNVEPQTT